MTSTVAFLAALTSLGAGQSFDIEISNPNGVYAIEDWTSGSYSQRVTERTPTRIVVRTEVAERLPRPAQAFPLEAVPESVERFLRPTRRIQSDSAAIGVIAAEIARGVDGSQQVDVIDAVLRWTQHHLTWAKPNEVPDALTCLRRRTCNCIGFSHLSAAILRRLGIPVRTVRAFWADPMTHELDRHTLIEVYFPSQDLWITYEPQTMSPPSGELILLGSARGWSSALQRKTRPFSVDPQTYVTSTPRSAP